MNGTYPFTVRTCTVVDLLYVIVFRCLLMLLALLSVPLDKKSKLSMGDTLKLALTNDTLANEDIG